MKNNNTVTNLKAIETLKRNDCVTLNRNCLPLSGIEFKAGDSFKFLGWYGGVGNLCRLSRIGDNAKLMVVPADIGYGFTPATVASVPAQPIAKETEKWDAPHTDESGASRRIVIATCLAGQYSGETAMHMTPAEEREYNAGMAKMAEMYPG